MTLNEGGNVFANAEPFDHKDVPAILKTVNAALEGTGIRAIPVGSAATPTPGKQSGDMDVIVDEKAVLEYFKAKDAKTARKSLSDFINQRGLETAQSGINVHVNVPVGDNHHQVDIMVAGNAEKVAKFHTHDIPQGSPYKGVNKQLMLAILAKSKGYMWSAWQGLFARTPEGKKGDFVTDDLDSIAEILTGVANSKVLGSVESILKALPDDEASALLDRAKQDPNWVEKPTNEEISRIKKLAGVKETDIVSPRFSGLQKTQHADGSTTTDYQAGPMQATQKVDAQGNPIKSTAKYNIGLGTLGAEQDHVSGIRTTTATPADPNADPNQLLPTNAIAAAKGVDPKKFAKFQRQNTAAREALDAMLRIARLK